MDFRSLPARSRQAPDSIKIDGAFIPSRKIKIRSEFNGRVENLSVVQGQAVARQVSMFRIEDEGLRGDLEARRDQLRIAESQLELTRSLAAIETSSEELAEETVLESTVELPVYAAPSYQVPTFSRLASEIPFTSEDAGGIWPGIDPRIIATSKDDRDAGGIWPSYGAREMVNGEGRYSTWEAYFEAAAVPMPASPTEFTRVQNLILTQPTNAAEAPTEQETATPASKLPDTRIALYQARIDRIRAEIAIIENDLAGREISSPLDGKVQELLVSEGSEVLVGDFLAEVYQVNPIEFSFQVPKDQVDFLELGMRVKGRLSVAPGLAFEGDISYIGAELDADNGTAEVRARMDNADDAFKVGMKGAAEIDIGVGFTRAMTF